MSGGAGQAERSLRQLDRLTRQTSSASRSMATGVPLLGWGIGWMIGLGALDLLEGVPRVVGAGLGWSVGMLMSWLPLQRSIRTGTESRMRAAWITVFLTSPLLVAAARPTSWVHTVLLLGALWGLAMCLHAIATRDGLLAGAAVLGIVTAGVLGSLDLPHRLLVYGVCAGGSMLLTGAFRAVAGARHG